MFLKYVKAPGYLNCVSVLKTWNVKVTKNKIFNFFFLIQSNLLFKIKKHKFWFEEPKYNKKRNDFKKISRQISSWNCVKET